MPLERNIMPIYYVIAEWVRNPAGYGVYNIVEVIETTLEDVLHNIRIDERVREHRDMGRQINTFMFTIPPKDIFEDWKPQ
jgi:hypothetical protein